MAIRFQKSNYFFMTLEPVHVGIGGYRLGRVDASIVREAGTNLPKIPGTSLHGTARHYAAYRIDKVDCAGQENHCGDASCPICYTFGFSKGSESQSYAGVVSISDARILFFPVKSMHGPVWVSSKNILNEAGIKIDDNPPDDVEAWTSLKDDGDINLGWLMLKGRNGLGINFDSLIKGGSGGKFKAIKDRIVLVDDSLFSRIVNSNLEVRTSVSINPKTGAASDKALYTYEAIPRAAFLYMETVVDDYRDGSPWNVEGAEWTSAGDVVSAGLEWMEYLGVGGMTTRGFGRLQKVAVMEV